MFEEPAQSPARALMGRLRARSCWGSTLIDASIATAMRSFTFHPGPRLIAGAARRVAGRPASRRAVPVRHRSGNRSPRTDRRLPRGARGERQAGRAVRLGRSGSVARDADGRICRGRSGRSAIGDRVWRWQPDGCGQARGLFARFGRRPRLDLGGGCRARVAAAAGAGPDHRRNRLEATRFPSSRANGG